MAVWTMDRLRIAVIMSVDVLQLFYHPGAEEPKDSQRSYCFTVLIGKADKGRHWIPVSRVSHGNNRVTPPAEGEGGQPKAVLYSRRPLLGCQKVRTSIDLPNILFLSCFQTHSSLQSRSTIWRFSFLWCPLGSQQNKENLSVPCLRLSFKASTND